MELSPTITALPNVLPIVMEPRQGPLQGSNEASSTAALTGGLVAGDEEAFRKFHADYFDRLFRYHLVVARGNEEMAREALQETFMRVARKPRQFDREDVFWSWLTVVARSAAIDAGRRRHRYWTLLKNYAVAWLRPEGAPALDSAPALHDFLECGLASLEPADRDLIEAKYFQGVTVRDLAGELGLTEKALESRLLRLRRKLREHILQNLRHERST